MLQESNYIRRKRIFSQSGLPNADWVSPGTSARCRLHCYWIRLYIITMHEILLNWTPIYRSVQEGGWVSLLEPHKYRQMTLRLECRSNSMDSHTRSLVRVMKQAWFCKPCCAWTWFHCAPSIRAGHRTACSFRSLWFRGHFHPSRLTAMSCKIL